MNAMQKMHVEIGCVNSALAQDVSKLCAFIRADHFIWINNFGWRQTKIHPRDQNISFDNTLIVDVSGMKINR